MPPTQPPPDPQSTPIRHQVLSIFQHHWKRRQTAAIVNPQVKKAKTAPHVPIHPSIRALVTQLQCISAPQGKQRLQLLCETAKQRVCSSTHLAALIFGIDDAEFMPPLCVIVNLLNTQMLRRDHVNEQLLVLRLQYEMSSPEICVCRSAANGISSLLHYATDVSHQQNGGFLLQSLVSALFPTSNHALGPMHLRSTLLVAEKTIMFVKQYDNLDGEVYPFLLEWAKRAALPTAYSQHITSDSEEAVIWTPELSGLATCRKCSEYLPEGELYESVLRKLFATVQPSDASDIYLACLNSFRNETSSGINTNYVSGTWARVVLLGQRISDRSSVDDVNEDIVKKTLSSVSGALGNLSATSDPYLTAVLICLTRRLLIPSPCFSEGKQRTKIYQQHKEWFRQFVVHHGRKTVEALMPALKQLLPLEPLELLRLNHRVFSSRTELARVTSDYLVNARSRISELDPSPRNFLSEEEAATAEQFHQDIKNSPKLILAAAHFVKDFVRTREIPRPLLRQINFHRSHFQRTTKVALLDAMLAQYVRETDDPHFIAEKDKFESHQINLIRHLAFKGNIRAISAAEANTAIKSIQETRNKRVRPVDTLQNSNNDRQLSIHDSIDEIIGVALNTAARSHQNKDGEPMQKTGLSSTEILRLKLKQILSTKTKTDLPELVCEVLHGLLVTISFSMPQITVFNNDEEQKPLVLRDHEKWWASTGKALRGVLLEVFGDSDIQCLQKCLQYQLFALICTATDLLPLGTVRSAATLTVTILTLHSESSLTDLCFARHNSCSAMPSLLNVIIECLPFNCGSRVRNSVSFIFYCTLMLHSASEVIVDVFVESHDDAQILKTQGTRQAFQTVCKEKLNSLLVFMQWIMCFPWRLENTKRKKSRSAAQSLESSSLVNQVSKLFVFLKHQEFQDQVGVSRILGVEVRCGWGYEDTIYSFLEQMELAGICSKSMLCEVIHLLSTRDNSVACSLGWIQNAVVRFAKDRTWCQRKVNGHTGRDASGVEYLCQEVDSCGAHVGREVFDMLLLTDQCFFHNLSISEAIRCIMFDLIPRFWPLPRRQVLFVVNNLNAKCITRSNLDHGLADMYLFTANICAVVVHDQICRALDGLSIDLHNVLSDIGIAQEISQIAELIRAMDGGNEEDVSAPVIKYSVCLGSVMVLSLCRNDVRGRQEHHRSLLTRRVSLMCRILPSPLACEVLDSALSTAAVIPFCFRFTTTGDHRLKLKETTEWMRVLTSERLALSDSCYTIPNHTREELRGFGAKKEPLVQTCLQWLGRSNQIIDEDVLGKCLPIAVCMGRVLGSLHSMDKHELKGFLERVGAKMTQTLLSNSLRAYESLSSKAIYWPEKLPSTTMQRLKEARLEVQRNLLQAVGSVLRIMQEIADEDFDESLTNVLRPHQEIEDEVRSVLSLGRATS